MRLLRSPPTLLSLLAVCLSHNAVNAGPYPKDSLHDQGYSFLQERACDSYCGAQNQYCCSAGQACYTNQANVAYCSVGTGAANQAQPSSNGYAVYTFTYTETDLAYRTTTSTSYWQAATSTSVWVAPVTTAAVAVPAICTVQGQTSCGIYCCAIDQICGGVNSCIPRPESSLFPTPGTTGGSPLRPTSGGVLTATSTFSVTTTQPFISPATASGTTLPPALTQNSGGSGLSPGAIAGIVIGVLAGIILLILLCFCCIVKAGFDGLLAIFGLGKKKRRSTERIETVERFSRHGSGSASRRETHGGWFGGGGRPARVDASRKKKSSGLGGLGAVGVGLAGLAVILGLKKKHDKSEKPARSEISSSYYTDSYTGTSASSASSDRRTRQSGRR